MNVVIWLLLVTVVLLAICVVGLFAMFGELASKVAHVDSAEGSEARLQELPGIVARHDAIEWPAPLAHVADLPSARVLVLSTICVSCSNIADALSRDATEVPIDLAAIVVSTPTLDRGAQFVERYGLAARCACWLDESGAWLIDSFELMTSPAALDFSAGKLTAARTFDSLESLVHADLTHPGEVMING